MCSGFFSYTRCLFFQSYSTGAHADLLPPLPPSSRATHAPHPPHHHHHHHHHRSHLSVCVLPPAMVQLALLRSLLLWCLVWYNFCCVVCMYVSSEMLLWCCLWPCRLKATLIFISMSNSIFVKTLWYCPALLCVRHWLVLCSCLCTTVYCH